MIKVTEKIAIDDAEIRESFVRSSGPGGQNVNKVSTAVQLRFDARNSRSLGEDVRERLVRLAGKRMTRDGVLVIESRRFRTQDRNRRDARDRLAALVRKAAQAPVPRRKSAPRPEAKERRLEAKRQRAEIKCGRRGVPSSGE